MMANPDYLSVELTRRQRALIRAAGTQSVVLICSAPRRYRSNDVEHRYRQNSDFAYLTGLAEIDALAVFVPGSARAEYTLFYTPPKPEQVIWEGGGLSAANIKKRYGVERIHPKEQFDEIFPQMLAGKKRLYCSFDQAGTSENMVAVIRTLRQARRAKASLDELIALETLSHPLRLKKSGFEMRLIKKAVDIAVTSHENNMRLCRPGLSERDIEAQILKTLRENDAHPSYPPIVASGANACTLHYTKNNAALRDNQLLLVDAGAEYRLYASDITRTYPINGRFRPPQRELYELVLEAQLAAIKQVRPGSCWSEVHRAAIQVLVRGLRSLKILRGEISTLMRKKAWQPYYMHGTGHWLGMDVHDAGGYHKKREEIRFAAGMVLTVEPGLYMPADSKLPAYWRRVGIRIEDDVQVTSRGRRVLSEKLAKTCEAIERLMAS